MSTSHDFLGQDVQDLHALAKKSSPREGDYVLRITDKSGIFHIGHKKDYERKAEAYREKTKAYMEVTSNPLWEIFNKAVHLLNDLRSKKHLFAYQHDKMMPKRDEVELAFLYFLPKPHKVNLTVFFLKYNSLSFLLIGRNTITSNCLFDAYTYNCHFEVSG